MMRKVVCLFAMGLVAALAGCGEKKVVDQFTKATLREATFGEVASDGFKYKISKPTVVDTLGNFVVIRQTNLTEFVTGNNIAQVVGKLGTLSDLTFNVVKRFKPVVHFQCMSIVTASDSVIVPQDKPIAFPRIADAATYDPTKDWPPIELVDIRYDNTVGLRDLIGKKMSFTAKLLKVDTDSTAFWMLEGDKPCPSPFLRNPERIVPARLRVKTPRPVLEIVLRMLEKTGTDFEGGVTFVGVEPMPSRGENQIAGVVEIGWVRFLDVVYIR
jgi:hypothetical protein